jgi:DNA-binding protein HU-beta
MALKKTAGETAGTAKKSAPKKAGAAKKAAPKKAAVTATATKKKAAPKKAAGPKLSDPQTDMLKKVATAGETGYHAEKKPENKTLETLLKHKLVKKGKKHASGNYHYSISKAGTKHLATPPAPSAPKSS